VLERAIADLDRTTKALEARIVERG